MPSYEYQLMINFPSMDLLVKLNKLTLSYREFEFVWEFVCALTFLQAFGDSLFVGNYN